MVEKVGRFIAAVGHPATLSTGAAAASQPTSQSRQTNGLPQRRSSPGAPASVASQAPRRPAMIGVSGGMGPEAGIQFAANILDDNPEARVILHQATNMPDRTKAIEAKSNAPVRPAIDSMGRLRKAGVGVFAEPCNTQHVFRPGVVAGMKAEGNDILPAHIVDASLLELFRQDPNARKIGLLATDGTLGTELYQNRARELGYDIEFVTPDTAHQKEVMRGIYEGVKAGDNALGTVLLLKAAEHLKTQGVDAMLLACTEIPLVLKTGQVIGKNGRELPLIDTLDALAKGANALSAETGSQVNMRNSRFTVCRGSGSRLDAKIFKFLKGSPARQRIIGGVGMGPADGLAFGRRLIKLNPATTDQGHTRAMIDMATRIPAPTGRDGKEAAMRESAASLRMLSRSGAHVVAIASAELNALFPQMERLVRDENLKIDLLHIADATMVALQREAPYAKKVALLATEGTLQARLYQNRASEMGRTVAYVTPDPAYQAMVNEAISASCDPATRARLMDKVARHMQSKGAEATVVAAPHLADALKEIATSNATGPAIPVIDSLEAQARKCIELGKVPVPATPGVLRRIGLALGNSHRRAHAAPSRSVFS